MARANFDLIGSPQDTTTERDLSRLLGRLQKTLLQPSSSSSSLRTSYERNKVRANLDYARALLLRLEHNSQAAEKDAAQKSIATQQVPLEEHRTQLRRLQRRLAELNQAAPEEDETLSDSASDQSNNEFWDRYAPVVPKSPAPNGIESTKRGQVQEQRSYETAAAPTSTLRSRKQGVTPTATATTTSDIARSSGIASMLPAPQPTVSPFAPLQKRGDGGAQGTGAGASEALAAHHAEEQEKLTASLVTLATALKKNTMNFSEALTASDSVVDRATTALDKNVSGMGAAGSRMSSLRRMTEGRGWWSRISLYAWIAILWVAAILIVFVLPKLRF